MPVTRTKSGATVYRPNATQKLKAAQNNYKSGATKGASGSLARSRNKMLANKYAATGKYAG